MISFKNGDKVYCPMKSTKVLTITSDKKPAPYSIEIRGQEVNTVFTVDGLYARANKTSSLFHATQENKEILEKLYGIEFEIPPSPTKTVTIQLPESFIPKLGEKYWMITNFSKQCYCFLINRESVDDKQRISQGVWRTQEDIKTMFEIFSFIRKG